MVLEDLEETVHAENFPPSCSLHDREATSQDVPDITTTSNVGWKSTIRDGDQKCSSVIKNNIKVLNWLDCGFNSGYINANLI
jgi:hypothetical protein